MAYELLEICRTCLNKDEKLLPLTSTIDHESFNIIDYFKKYLHIEYIENDNQMPTNICLKCFDRLLEVRKFSIQCRESENYLKVKLTMSMAKKAIKDVEIKYEILEEKNDYAENEPYTNIEVLYDDFMEIEKIDQDSNLLSENNKKEKYDDSEILDNNLEFNSLLSENSKEEKYEHSENADNNLEFDTVTDSDSLIPECNEDPLNNINTKKKDYSDKYNNSEKLDYQCELYGSEFSNIKDYLHHKTHKTCTIDDKINVEKKLGRNLPNNSCLCPKCGREFSTKKKMQTHLYKHNQSVFICNKCGKVYHHYGSFKEHDFLHQGIKPYKCEYCDKEFRQKTAQIIHMKLHTGKDIECKLCDKKFAVQSQLRIHMTYHTNDLKFSCDICPKRYRKNNLLQMHKATHSDKKTVKCEYCDSYFYTKDALRTHKNSVHIRKYFCNLCPRRFPNPADLKKHFLNNHEISIEDVSQFKKKLNEITLLMTKSANNEDESEVENI